MYIKEGASPFRGLCLSAYLHCPGYTPCREHLLLLTVQHQYLLGQDSTKLLYIEQYTLARIAKREGVFFVDATGKSVERMLHQIPKNRCKDVILFDPSQEEVVGFNPLADCSPLSVSILADTFKEAWGYGDTPTPTMDMYLYFSIAALSANGLTLESFPQLLTDKRLRQSLKLKDKVVRDFWDNFDTFTDKEQRAEIASTLNKALMLIADERVRKALSFSSFTMEEVVRDNKILLVSLKGLSKGRATLLGSVLLSLITQAVAGRVNTTPFHVILPNCHMWVKEAQKELLTNGETFNTFLTVSNEYIDQLERDLYAAIIANCEEQLVFRLSQDDAKRLVDRMGRWKPDVFVDLKSGQFHSYPVNHATPFSVEISDKPPYPKSLADIRENHRRNLWG